MDIVKGTGLVELVTFAVNLYYLHIISYIRASHSNKSNSLEMHLPQEKCPVVMKFPTKMCWQAENPHLRYIALLNGRLLDIWPSKS